MNQNVLNQKSSVVKHVPQEETIIYVSEEYLVVKELINNTCRGIIISHRSGGYHHYVMSHEHNLLYKRRRTRHTQPQPHLSVRDIPFLEREPPTGDEVQDTGPYWSVGHDVHCQH